jgi:hypothetical protein
MTLGIMTWGKTTLGAITLGKMTVSIIGIFMTISVRI